jgi:hypothetical protein
MNTLVPIWILGGPFIGLVILAFAFKGPSAMGGTLPRTLPRERAVNDRSAPILDPIHPDAPRRFQ